jgi:hypothetical protein
VVSKDVRGRGKRGEVVWRRTILNQEGKVVQEGVTVTLVETRPPQSPSVATSGLEDQP